MTDEELKQLVASLAIAQRQTDEELKQLAATTAAQFQETDRKMQKTDRQIKELGKQIGGLGEKFGSFTEAMAFPSMRKVLTKTFHMDNIATRYLVRKNGRSMELDVFAYNNGTSNQAVIVEMKSHLRDEHIERILNLLKEAREFLPEHANKDFYGILAVVDAPEHLKAQVFKQGIYYAEIHDNIFELKTPPGFQARAF